MRMLMDVKQFRAASFVHIVVSFKVTYNLMGITIDTVLPKLFVRLQCGNLPCQEQVAVNGTHVVEIFGVGKLGIRT